MEAMTCVLNIMTDTINNDASSLFSDVSDDAWATLDANIAPAANAAVQAAWALMKTKAQKAKFAAFFGAAALAAAAAVSNGAGDTPDVSPGPVGKINIPAAGVGVPEEKGCDGSEKLNKDSVSQGIHTTTSLE